MVYPSIGRNSDSALLSGRQHVLQEQTDTRKDQSVDFSAVCGDCVDTADTATVVDSTATRGSHQSCSVSSQ